MMDLLKAAGTGTEVTIGGRTFTLSPIRVRHLAENNAWAISRLGNPITVVLESLHSPAGRDRDLWAAKVLARHQRAMEPVQKLRAEIDAEVEAARRVNRTPDPGIVNRAADGPSEDLEAEATLARQWLSERRELLLTAYRDAYGPKPSFDDPIFMPLRNGLEGMCHEVWLSIRQKHPDAFATHMDLLDFTQDHLLDFLEARKKLADLNDPDPEKNSPGRRTDQTPAAGTTAANTAAGTAEAPASPAHANPSIGKP